jgi:hypothetical protein
MAIFLLSHAKNKVKLIHIRFDAKYFETKLAQFLIFELVFLLSQKENIAYCIIIL